jgi:hypothetical protein
MLIIILLITSAHANEIIPVELKQAIDSAAKVYSVDPRDLQRIAFVEGSWKLHPKDRRNANGTIDTGPFQVNSVHWNTTCKHMNVRTTLGNAMCAAKLLRSHKKFSHVDSEWVGRYHSKTPSRKIKYAQKLARVVLANN